MFRRPRRGNWTGVEVTMSLSGSRTGVVCRLAAACCVLTLLSCGRSPSAPGGLLLVFVSDTGGGPVPGKRIELRGTSLSRFTDENGLAPFTVHAGSYVVRAYEIGTPGPGRPFVEQSIEVESARISRAQFTDCAMCRIETSGSGAAAVSASK